MAFSLMEVGQGLQMGCKIPSKSAVRTTTGLWMRRSWEMELAGGTRLELEEVQGEGLPWGFSSWSLDVSNAKGAGWILARELRFHMPHGQTNQYGIQIQ